MFSQFKSLTLQAYLMQLFNNANHVYKKRFIVQNINKKTIERYCFVMDRENVTLLQKNAKINEHSNTQSHHKKNTNETESYYQTRIW